MADLARIEDRLDRVVAGSTEVSDALGGLRFQNMTEVMEFAKLMSLSGNAVPKHLQANPGMCLAVCVQALEWRFSPFAVANKSYEVQGRLSFESQLVHAVIEQRAPIIGRLMHRFEGDGDDRRCIVWAILKETGEKLEYISPPFSKIQPKNSPLWKTKPDLQQYYNTSRDFCRAYFPDVLLGVYSEEELRDHVGPDNAKDVTKPNIKDRLKGSSKERGFSHQHVERETRGAVVDESATQEQSNPSQVSTPSPIPDAETGPAAEGDTPVSPAAGNSSNDSAEAAGEPAEREAVDEPGPGPSLPEGWQRDYAAALKRALKPDSLPKYAKQFWTSINVDWNTIKNTADGEQAALIYDAFTEHFDNKKALEEVLRELVGSAS